MNCIDCLDRTNVVQGLLGRKHLEYVLDRAGLLDATDILALPNTFPQAGFPSLLPSLFPSLFNDKPKVIHIVGVVMAPYLYNGTCWRTYPVLSNCWGTDAGQTMFGFLAEFAKRCCL